MMAAKGHYVDVKEPKLPSSISGYIYICPNLFVRCSALEIKVSGMVVQVQKTAPATALFQFVGIPSQSVTSCESLCPSLSFQQQQ
ncbi:hypothetical protein SUGI_0060690 [Cryptomeria japonica]|nr:hypothetical protein SUGI_0060690 [Cryptomeria japonica]